MRSLSNATRAATPAAFSQGCIAHRRRSRPWVLFPGQPDASGTSIAILQAIVAHLYVAWIHPFGDGNGRTARSLEFLILARAGLPTPVAHLLSNHYNETRAEYYRQLSAASESGGDVNPFIRYAIQGLIDGLHAQLSFIRAEHMRAAWESYVFDRFRALRRTEAAARQRDLVLELSVHPEPIPKKQLRLISTAMAQHYGGMTDKAVTRDLNVLKKLGLVQRAEGGYRARTELMLAFMPYHRLRGPAPAAAATPDPR